jgi:DNA gyrase subunit B
VEKGHIYIAQPPLYKVKTGKHERYLKDDYERDQFMLSQALIGASLVPREGAVAIDGAALEQLAKSYLLAQAVVQRVSRTIDVEVLLALLRGVRANLSSAESAAASAAALKQAISGNGSAEVNIRVRYDEKTERQQLLIERNHHGNLRSSMLDEEFLLSGDYKQIETTAQMLQGLIGEGARVKRDDKERAIPDFAEAMHWLLAEVERGSSVQRYKGLGEMNPEQLWETTMDPGSRRLLKVQIEDGIAADEIFNRLMGDDVEPRRLFIEQNALIARLDV